MPLKTGTQTIIAAQNASTRFARRSVSGSWRNESGMSQFHNETSGKDVASRLVSRIPDTVTFHESGGSPLAARGHFRIFGLDP
ncbi:MAG TPA: hypothetical protein VMV10_09285 [Pirellulales bacterium]|nr:hypothetical protein [Pirellulales bacterium]